MNPAHLHAFIHRGFLFIRLQDSCPIPGISGCLYDCLYGMLFCQPGCHYYCSDNALPSNAHHCTGTLRQAAFCRLIHSISAPFWAPAAASLTAPDRRGLLNPDRSVPAWVHGVAVIAPHLTGVRRFEPAVHPLPRYQIHQPSALIVTSGAANEHTRNVKATLVNLIRSRRLCPHGRLAAGGAVCHSAWCAP